MTERLHFHFSLSLVGGGNGIPLQYSCLENPRDGGAGWAAVYGVAELDTTEATQQQLQQSVAQRVSVSIGLSWQEYWTGLPFPPPRNQTHISCISSITGQFFISEPSGKPILLSTMINFHSMMGLHRQMPRPPTINAAFLLTELNSLGKGMERG